MGGCRENVVPWGFGLANNLVFKKVRAALGLDRCKICLTGAAPITKDTLEYFMSLNIPLMEIYGMSESSGPHTVSSNEEYRITRSADINASHLCLLLGAYPTLSVCTEISQYGINFIVSNCNLYTMV